MKHPFSLAPGSPRATAYYLTWIKRTSPSGYSIPRPAPGFAA